MRSPALAAATLLLAACPEAGPVGGEPDPVQPATLVGTYQVASHLEVPATAAAPGPLGDSLRLLHELSVNPAGGLLDMAEQAGAPALGTLRAVLPGSLEGEIESWMNAYLETATVNGVSPHDEIVALDAQVRSVLLGWDLRSTLDLPVSGAGTHAPVALVFGPAEASVVVPVSATAPVTAATGVTATISWPGGAGNARATIGDHAMGIPFGHYALAALDVLVERQLGAPGIGGALDRIVDCAGLAASVAGRCIGFVCVGHEAELSAVCEAGVDAAADQIEERILAIDYQAIHLVSGTAEAEGVAADAAGTATATALAGGVWTATVDLGQEPEAANATFSAVR